jgi:hypothetical protein
MSSKAISSGRVSVQYPNAAKIKRYLRTEGYTTKQSRIFAAIWESYVDMGLRPVCIAGLGYELNFAGTETVARAVKRFVSDGLLEIATERAGSRGRTYHVHLPEAIAPNPLKQWSVSNERAH